MSDKILYRTNADGRILFWCPGCGCAHFFQPPHWNWDGNEEKPTVTPSILVRGTRPVTDEEVERIMAGEKIEPEPTICHLFLTAGVIHFCGDCTHEFAGKLVPMEAF